MKKYILQYIALVFCSLSFAQTGNVNLNNHSNPNPPSGTVFQWHTGNPPTVANLLTSQQAADVPAGTYYAVFYDSLKNCYSPATTLKVKNNDCPAVTVNLNNFTSSNTPTGTTLEWHTSNTPTQSNKVSDPTKVSNGTYYAFFYDSTNGCYSPPTPIIVSVKDCVAFCLLPAATDGPNITANVGISTIGKGANWPQNITAAQLALESESKGLVISRLKTSEFANITKPVEGMIAYDTDVDCLKIYNLGTWKCFNIQTCPN